MDKKWPGALGLRSQTWIALTGIALAAIYGKLVLENPILLRDDQHILAHLKGWETLRYLLASRQLGALIAFQPVTELSLRLGLHHLVNLSIWVLILVFAFRILSLLLREKTQYRYAWIALAAVHPLFVGSVAWVSARKHLLCCLFILVATELWIRACRKRLGFSWATAGACFAYALALLSHPIGVLWPLWACLHARRQKQDWRSILVGISPCLGLMVAGAAANLIYYSSSYVSHTTQAKILWSSASPSIALLALGRYAFNFFAPGVLAATYYPGSIWNMIGVAILSALAILAYRLRGAGREWLLFALLPLLPVTLIPTNVFVSDTYALISGIGLILALAVALNGSAVLSTYAFMAVFCALSVLSARQARTWGSDEALWAHTVALEKSPRALAAYSTLLLDERRIDEARPRIDELARWDPEDRDLPYLYARSIYLDSRLGADTKIAMLESHPSDRPWALYFLAASFAGANRYKDADTLLERALATHAQAREFGTELAAITAEAEYFCRRSGRSECAGIEDRLKRQNPESWIQAGFDSRRQALEGRP